MKIALDPFMFRGLPMAEMVRTVADLGYEHIELSPREEFMPFFRHPRADDERVAELRAVLRETGLDGAVTACAFAREERARESSECMLQRLTAEFG